MIIWFIMNLGDGFDFKHIDYTGDFDISCCRPELLREHAWD